MKKLHAGWLIIVMAAFALFFFLLQPHVTGFSQDIKPPKLVPLETPYTAYTPSTAAYTKASTGKSLSGKAGKAVSADSLYHNEAFREAPQNTHGQSRFFLYTFSSRFYSNHLKDESAAAPAVKEVLQEQGANELFHRGLLEAAQKTETGHLDVTTYPAPNFLEAPVLNTDNLPYQASPDRGLREEKSSEEKSSEESPGGQDKEEENEEVEETAAEEDEKEEDSTGHASSSGESPSEDSSTGGESEEGEEEEEEEKKEEEKPLEYRWGNTRHFHFQVKVKITNEGNSTSSNVSVEIPMLENDSPYQDTQLEEVSHEKISSSGRMTTFKLGDLPPGETETLVIEYAIQSTPVSLVSSNDTVEKAKEIFDTHAGSGNCHQLATAFVEDARAKGLTARVVTGFARPSRGDMTPGCLSGARHSWAEFHVENLGWVPADLTFEYFAELPYASHLVEGYAADDAISINGQGGKLTGTWENSVK